MSDRLPIRKTYKLFVGGEFPRSESGRTYRAEGQNVARASRKDLRDAVRAARAAFAKWSAMTAYNRGQVLYRLAEMMEARRSDLAALCSGAADEREPRHLHLDALGHDHLHTAHPGEAGDARLRADDLRRAEVELAATHDRDHACPSGDPPAAGSARAAHEGNEPARRAACR